MADQTAKTPDPKAAEVLAAAAKADAESKANTEAKAAEIEEVVNAGPANVKRVNGVLHYRLLRGKFNYIDDDGESIRAVAGDYIPLTPAQLEAFKDLVATNSTSVEEIEAVS